MRRILWVSIAAAFVSINLGIAGLRMAAAAGVAPNAICVSPSPCLTWINNGKGVGLFGVGAQNNGVEGHVKGASTLGLTASGVYGADFSTGTSNAGVSASSLNGDGVISFGALTGVFADATSTTKGTGLFASGAQEAVFAETQGVGGGIAVRARSQDLRGYMFYGESTDSGKFFTVSDSADVQVGGNLYDDQVVSGAGGVYSNCITSSCQAAIYGSSGTGFALFGQAMDQTSIGVEAVGGGGIIMEGQNMNQTPVFDLDDSGNLTIAGVLTTSGSCHVGCAAPHHPGRHVSTFATQATEPVTEDFGQGQLVNGAAYVRLDAAFANVIDSASNYLVFITPEGDSKGLYVTQKSATGFAVRESQAGRSTIAFDYRIVAKPFGPPSSRLPMTVVRQGVRVNDVKAPAFHPLPMTSPTKPVLAHQ